MSRSNARTRTCSEVAGSEMARTTISPGCSDRDVAEIWIGGAGAGAVSTRAATIAMSWIISDFRLQTSNFPKVKIPGFGDQVGPAEVGVRRLVDAAKARLLVQPPRGVEVALRPERQFPVAGLPREPDAL